MIDVGSITLAEALYIGAFLLLENLPHRSAARAAVQQPQRGIRASQRCRMRQAIAGSRAPR
jgi:hypothetical protein